MNFPFQIAQRYLFSKKSINIINLISILSVIGVGVGTAALIVVLSAFNGISGFIEGMLSNFDADIKISINEGKSFSHDSINIKQIMNIDNVISYSEIVEDNVLFSANGKQKYGIIKGVDIDYPQLSGIDSTIIFGEFKLNYKDTHRAVLGYGVALDLDIRQNSTSPIHIYYPKRTSRKTISIDNAFNHEYIFAQGIFSIQQEIDNQYVLVPIDFARDILQLNDKVTSIEVKLTSDANVKAIKNKIKDIVGSKYLVQDRYEQHTLIYQIMKSEKWASFLILGFILLIASFNLLGSLTMIILDKKDDIFVLRSMGADSSLIKKIFLIEGWLISLIGATSGIIFGILLVWLQTKFELIKLPSNGSFAISAYPMSLQAIDILATISIVLIIGFFVSWYPTRGLKIESYQNQ